VFAWHLFLQRLAHRRHQDTGQAEQDNARPDGLGAALLPDHGQDSAGPDPRMIVRALLAAETPQSRVTAVRVQAKTGLSRSRAYAVLRQLRSETASANGQGPPSAPEQDSP